MLLIKDATVYTMEDSGVLENCSILVRDGKIAAIGPDLCAPDAEVFDAKGLYVTPGLIDAHSHAGGMNTKTLGNSDVNEGSEPITPQIQVIYGIDIHSDEFQSNKRAGVTAVCIAPGSSNVIGGQAFAAKTHGRCIFDAVLKNPCAMKCAMGGSPKGHGRRGGSPQTRMGVVAMLDNELTKAREYLNKKEAARDASELPAPDDKAEALLPVLRREIPIKVHCEQFDMVSVIELSKKHNIRYTIDHGWSSNVYLDELVAGGGPVLFGPIGIADSYSEADGGDVFLLKGMDDSGLDVSIISDCPVYTPDLLMITAGEAVRYGLDPVRALRMLTINPARALGVDDRIGSIAVGKDADFAIFEGEPAVDCAAHVCCTIIDGQIVWQK